MKQRETVFFSIMLCITLFVSGCASSRGVEDLDTEIISSGEVSPVLNPEKPQQKDMAQHVFSSMSLEDKIGQLFIIDLRKPGTGDPYQQLNNHVKTLINDYHPGGVILFGGNLRSPYQTKKFITDMQNLTELGLFVATDEEGGPISRLNYSPLMSPGKMPSAEEIGKTGDNENAFRAGKIIGKELRMLGINMNNAPVADILTNPQNPVIGPRAFGSNPEIVGQMAAAFMQGLRQEKVIAVLKHFPGHGDTVSDSHSGAVYVNHTLKRLKEMEFVPFNIGIANDAPVIMTAHITISDIESIPATFSYKLLSEILREEMQFRGLIISDSLAMGAITRYWQPGDAAVNALKAGIDIVLIPDNLKLAYDGVIQAVKSGELSLELIDEKVKRILKLKEEYGILDKSTVFPDINEEWSFPEIEDFRQEMKQNNQKRKD